MSINKRWWQITQQYFMAFLFSLVVIVIILWGCIIKYEIILNWLWTCTKKMFIWNDSNNKQDKFFNSIHVEQYNTKSISLWDIESEIFLLSCSFYLVWFLLARSFVVEGRSRMTLDVNFVRLEEPLKWRMIWLLKNQKNERAQSDYHIGIA